MKTLHYAPLHNLTDWIALGWIVRSVFEGSNHGNYSVLVEWLCDCPMVKPAALSPAPSEARS